MCEQTYRNVTIHAANFAASLGVVEGTLVAVVFCTLSFPGSSPKSEYEASSWTYVPTPDLYLLAAKSHAFKKSLGTRACLAIIMQPVSPSSC